MKRKNKCKKLGFSTVLWTVALILLCTGTGVWALDIPNDENEYSIPGDYGPVVTETIWVYGTLNILPGAVIQGDVIATDNSTVNITGGTVTAGWWVDVAPLANVTVYGTDFEIGGFPQPEGDVKINDILTVNTGSETEFSMQFYCFSGATVTLSAPSTDPVQMLIDLGLYILEQVEQYQEPAPPEILKGIAPELKVSLLAKVDAALDALDRGNPNDAKVVMNDMKALVNQVLAQTDKKISFEASDGIKGYAGAIVEALGG
ncbi:MAG TPA: hypothetical protein VMX36_09030 [Sedimentisphaerales bacterium]|nr:hypothetical protein [Sedimentisphaerales bacterium]